MSYLAKAIVDSWFSGRTVIGRKEFNAKVGSNLNLPKKDIKIVLQEMERENVLTRMTRKGSIVINRAPFSLDFNERK